MVPFIDVMLVLLIIFMVTAPLIAPSVINLPSIGKANKQPDKVIQISISEVGKFELKADANAEPIKGISADNIVNMVSKAQKGDNQTTVVISADQAVKYGNVVEVMDKLQRAGIQRVGLSVQLAK